MKAALMAALSAALFLAPVAHADPPNIADCPAPLLFGKCNVEGWENATGSPRPAARDPRADDRSVIIVQTPKLPDGKTISDPCAAVPALCAGVVPSPEWKVTQITPPPS